MSREKLLSMMAGGEELDKLEVELKEMDRISRINVIKFLTKIIKEISRNYFLCYN